MTEPTIRDIKALDGRIEELLDDDAKAVLKHFIQQGRKDGVAVTLTPDPHGHGRVINVDIGESRRLAMPPHGDAILHGRAAEDLARQELAVYAKTLTGPYPERYEKILTRAFLVYGEILPARPLREIAGGGTHGTAQHAVDKWIRDLHAKVKYRITSRSDVPPSLVAMFEEALPRMWDLAHQEASREFDAERDGAKRRYTALENEFHIRAQELNATIELLGGVRNQLAAAQERINFMGAEIERLEAALTRAHADQATTAEDKLKLEAKLGAAHAELSQERMRFESRLAEQEREFTAKLSAEVERGRREVNNIQSQAEKTIFALQAEKRELQLARDKAVKESTEAEIARARAERDAAELRQQASAANEAVAAAQKEKDDAQTSLREQQAVMGFMKDDLALARSKAIDTSMLLQWVLDGLPAEIPDMHPSLAAIAQVLKSSKRGKR